ncbi:hypothetical protein TNCV_125391 [Trichonephila clavipes]|nr:hypothetical protein TNCV_125391 [Trichonephila clavipes]
MFKKRCKFICKWPNLHRPAARNRSANRTVRRSARRLVGEEVHLRRSAAFKISFSFFKIVPEVPLRVKDHQTDNPAGGIGSENLGFKHPPQTWIWGNSKRELVLIIHLTD